MGKTKAEIEKEGGKCERVATDFIECTDKDGTVWWCRNSGECIKAPLSSSSKRTIGDLINEGAKCTLVRDDLSICKTKDGTVWSCEKQSGSCTVIIRSDKPTSELREKIKIAAVKALRTFPSEGTCGKYNSEISQFIIQGRRLIQQCSQAEDMSDEELECVATQIAFIYSSFNVGFGHGRLGGVFDNSGGQSCTFKCKSERDSCLAGDGCTGGWPCFCCVPCNIAWLACTADCII